MVKIIKFFILLILTLSTLVVEGQVIDKKSKRKKARIERVQKRRFERELKAKRKRHLKLQTEEVRERMKKHKKRSDKFYKRRKRFRLFRKIKENG